MATTVDFYKVTFKTEEPLNKNSVEDYFKSLLSNSHSFKGQYDLDFYDFKLVNGDCYGGIFRKIRTDEIIETGRIGAAGKQLNYPKGEGKLETNHLVFFPKYNVIGYVRNVHANHYKRLQSCLCKAFGRDVEVSPLINKESIQNLLQNRQVVQLDISVPISVAMATNNGQSWSDKAMEAVAGTGGNVLKMQLNADLRSKTHGKIANAYENIINFMTNGATRAIVKTEDVDGAYQIIDLIADKISHTDDTYSYTKEIVTQSYIYEKVITAYMEKLDEIEQVS